MVWTPSIVLVALPWWLLTHQIAATSNELPCADDENCDSGLPQPAHALLGVSAKHGRTILDADDFQNSPPKKHALYKDHHEKCIFRATADCTTTGEPEVWREQQCHEYLPGCKGSSGWCDCNGNKIKEDWEVGFNCTGPNNYTSLLKEFGEILLKYKNTSYGSELKIAYGNFPECNYTEEELTGHGGHWTACLNITCLPFCHPKTTTTTSTTITTTITTTSTSTATTTTTTTSTSTTTSTTSTTSTSTSTSSTTTTSTSTSTTTTTTTSTSTSTTTTTTTKRRKVDKSKVLKFVTIKTEVLSEKMSWKILKRKGHVTLCKSKPHAYDEWYSTFREDVTRCNLKPGVAYILQCLDKYGSGWAGGSIKIQGVTYCREDFKFRAGYKKETFFVVKKW
mmetsp:Transcript_70681/g.136415  ORF Transcript_70681/g.136415 Transcript_70681/m.136415 type:complete len:394 (-) Transcript_70681:16-1197(-)